jgi:hypothetical protein
MHVLFSDFWLLYGDFACGVAQESVAVRRDVRANGDACNHSSYVPRLSLTGKSLFVVHSGWDDDIPAFLSEITDGLTLTDD